MAAAGAIAPIIGQAVRAANTVITYTNTAGGALDLNTNWSGQTEPGIGNDALINGTTTSGLTSFTLNSSPETFGSLNDTNTSPITITGNKALTLGAASGDNGDSISGNTGDLIYVASGSTLNYGGTGGITLGQAGNFDFVGTGNISAPINDGGFGFTKMGSGTLTLSGNNSSFTGALTAETGTISLTGSVGAAPGSNTSALTLGGGTFSFAKTGTNTQSFGTTNISAGASVINNSVSTDTLALGNLSASTGATVDFTTLTGNVTTITANSSGGILGGWATTGGGANWAASAGNGTAAGAITGLTSGMSTTVGIGNSSSSYSALTGVASNIDVTGNAAITGGAISVNSLRFNSSTAYTLTLTGNNTIATGGILVTPSATNGGTITGGNLTSGSGKLVIVGTQALTISSTITNNGSTAEALVYSDSATSALSGANTYSGGTYINNGGINISTSATAFGTGTIYLGSTGDANTITVRANSVNPANAIVVNPGGTRIIGPGNGNAISYTGNITFNGGATLTLRTYNGNILVSGNLSGTGNLLFSDDTTRAASETVSGPVNIAGTITNAVPGSELVNISGNIGSNVTSVTQNSAAGSFILSGTNTFQSATDTTGYLDFQKLASLPSAAPVTIAAAGGLILGVGGATGFSSADVDDLFSSTSAGDLANVTINSASAVGLDTTGGNFTYNTQQTTTRLFIKNGANTLTLGASDTFGGLSSPNNSPNVGSINFSGTTLTLNVASGSPSYAGNLTGNGTLVKAGNGTQTLSGTGTYTGPTVISAGTLYNSGGLALLDSSSVTVNGTGLLEVLKITSHQNESTIFASGVVLQGTGGITNNSGADSSFVMDRANTYTGKTTFAGAALYNAGIGSTYDVNGNQTSGAFGVNSAVVFTGIGGETLRLSGFSNQVGSLAGTVNGYGGVELNNATLTVGGDNTSTSFTGQIGNNYLNGGDVNEAGSTTQTPGGNLTKIGNGTLTLAANGTTTAAGSYEGTTTIQGGILSINLLGTSGYQNQTLTATNNSATATVTNASLLSVGEYVYDAQGLPAGEHITAINTGNNTITLSAVVAGNSGNYSADFGYLSSIGISGNAAANLVLDGGTLQYTGAATSTDRLFTVGSNESGGATGTLDASGTGALNFTNTGPLAYGTTGQARTLVLTGNNTGNNTLTPAIGDNGVSVALTKTGNGTWVLAGTNSYSGATTVSAGTLIAGVASVANVNGAFGLNSAVTVANVSGATLALNNFNNQIGSLSGGGGTGGAVTLGNATLTDVQTTTTTFAGTVSGAGGGVTMAGNGTLFLVGANNYTGTTAITSGTLSATNFTGPVTVGTGAASSGTIAVGADTTTPGTLTSASTHTWEGGGTYQVKINDAGNATDMSAAGPGVAGSSTGWDLITMSGLSTANTGSTSFLIKLLSPSGATGSFNDNSPYDWTIAQFPDTATTNIGNGTVLATTDTSGNPVISSAFALDTSNFVTANGSAGTGTYQLELVDNGTSDLLEIQYSGYTPAPEPGTAMLVLAGGLPMLTQRRRRRRAERPNT